MACAYVGFINEKVHQNARNKLR